MSEIKLTAMSLDHDTFPDGFADYCTIRRRVSARFKLSFPQNLMDPRLALVQPFAGYGWVVERRGRAAAVAYVSMSHLSFVSAPFPKLCSSSSEPPE
jgi:hypothetical protein